MRITQIVDRLYIAVMVPIAAFVIYFNWHALHNVSGLVNYEHFRDIIKAGFNHESLITFPIWGYGFLMLITTDKLWLMIIQTSVALAALIYFVQLLEQDRIFSQHVIRAFKISMMFSLPWYAAHALRWPYSFTMSLVPVSVVLLYKAFSEQKASWYKLISSAVLFGIVLNFRSDYWLAPLGLALLLVLFFRTKRSFIQACVWTGVIYGCLLPWAFYAKKACGHYVITSTNAGHVTFIGLGNDPQNRWGIAPEDADPVMNNLVNEHFKTTHHSTLDYEADQFLKKTFLTYITAYPWDYAKKCVHAFKLLITDGFYPGEFFRVENGEVSGFKEQRLRELFINIVRSPVLLITHPVESLRIIVSGVSQRMGMILVFISYLLMPLTVWYAVRRRSLFMCLMLAVIVYQTMINTLCYQMVCYTSNLYIFYLLHAVFGTSLAYALVINWYYKLLRWFPFNRASRSLSH